MFIVKDPQRTVKDYLQRKGNGGVTRVLGVSKVRKRYGTHEGRRELLRQFDHFLVDHRVAPLMPRLLGKAFINSKRLPRSVNMNRDVIAGIERALQSTSFTPRRGTSTSVKVGHGDMSPIQVVQNCNAAIRAVIHYIKGWGVVQALHVKSGKSPALPIYLALPDQAVRSKADGSSSVAALNNKTTVKQRGPKRKRSIAKVETEQKTASPVKRSKVAVRKRKVRRVLLKTT